MKPSNSLSVSSDMFRSQAHDDLRGIDTEAAEQVFHIASRWQASLSAAHPVHQELQLLIFSHEHNERQSDSCIEFWERYTAKQLSPCPSSARTSASHGAQLDAVSCERTEPPPKKKRFVSSSCIGCEGAAAASTGPPAAGDPDVVPAPPVPAGPIARDFLGAESKVLGRSRRLRPGRLPLGA